MRTLAAVSLALSVATSACGKDRSSPPPPAVSASPSAPVASAPVASARPGVDEAARLCGQKSTCPNEPVDDEGTMLCTSIAHDPTCGAKFLALVKCQVEKEKCGADGKIDQVTTLDLCKAEDQAVRDCDQAKAAAAKSSAK